MYPTAYGPRTGVFNNRGMSDVYSRINVETSVQSASAHQLITMLYNGAIDAMNLAKAAIANQQIEAKGQAISKAIRIIDEGLKSSLNLDDGGELSQHLYGLYGYICTRLTLANLRNDPAVLDECISLLVPVREVWMQIAPQYASTQAAPAKMELRA